MLRLQQQVMIVLDGAKDVKPAGKLVSLSAATTAETNSITDPKRVVPVEGAIKGVEARALPAPVPGYSIEVYELGVQ